MKTPEWDERNVRLGTSATTGTWSPSWRGCKVHFTPLSPYFSEASESFSAKRIDRSEPSSEECMLTPSRPADRRVGKLHFNLSRPEWSVWEGNSWSKLPPASDLTCFQMRNSYCGVTSVSDNVSDPTVCSGNNILSIIVLLVWQAIKVVFCPTPLKMHFSLNCGRTCQVFRDFNLNQRHLEQFPITLAVSWSTFGSKSTHESLWRSVLSSGACYTGKYCVYFMLLTYF